jgi:hypothetical protein
MAKLRDGRGFAAQLVPVRGNDRWKEIEAALNVDASAAVQPAVPVRQRLGWRRWWGLSGAAVALILVAGMFVFYGSEREQMITGEVYDYTLNTGGFEAVKISEIQHNTKPHVVAEGYVSEVRLEPDGDLAFRLVEDLRQPEPFVVCEIVEPVRLGAPAVGSRVRVYGVSRYDNQPGRHWYEVHPVLGIEMLNK